jgi:hypothetical protein
VKDMDLYNDEEMSGRDLTELRAIVTDDLAGVSLRGRALMELARRSGVETADLLPEIKSYICDPTNVTAVVFGTITVSQMGLAGLVASHSKISRSLAVELAQETGPLGEEDLQWLVQALGREWPSSYS